MIVYREGNILTTKTEAVVNTVNCFGVMGKGLALSFKNRYPSNFYEYRRACEEQRVQIGKMFVHEVKQGIYEEPPYYIFNFPTKYHWKNSSKLPDIELGLDDMVDKIVDLNIKSIAIPPLGCGLGGLHWPDVHNLIRVKVNDARLREIGTKVVIYTP